MTPRTQTHSAAGAAVRATPAPSAPHRRGSLLTGAREAVADTVAVARDWWADRGPATVISGVVHLAGAVLVLGVALPWYVRNFTGEQFGALLMTGFALGALIGWWGIGTRRLAVHRVLWAVVLAWVWATLLPYAAGAWVLYGQNHPNFDTHIAPVTGGQMVAAQIGGAAWLFCRHVWTGLHEPTPPTAPGVAADGPHVVPDGEPVAHDLARHEAAHALVWALLGGQIVRIQLRPDRFANINAQITTRVARLDADNAWAAMVGALAGMVADHDHQVFDGGSQSDVTSAHRCATGLVAMGVRPTGYDGPLTIDALLQAAGTRARALLAQHRDEHDALTQAFVDAGQVTISDRAQVTALLARCGITNPNVQLNLDDPVEVRS